MPRKKSAAQLILWRPPVTKRWLSRQVTVKNWTELLSEDILLRDVIDLETTFGNQLGEGDEVQQPVVPVAGITPVAADATPELDADGNPIVVDEDDEETTRRPTCRLRRWRRR